MAPVCKFYQQGHCKFGEGCRFDHPTTPCKFYLQGQCKYGTKCRYSHNLDCGSDSSSDIDSWSDSSSDIDSSSDSDSPSSPGSGCDISSIDIGRLSLGSSPPEWTGGVLTGDELPAYLAEKYQAEFGSFVEKSNGQPDMRFTQNRKFFQALDKVKPVNRKDGRLDGRSRAARELKAAGVALDEFRDMIDRRTPSAKKEVNKLYHKVGGKSRCAEAQLRQIAADAFFEGTYDIQIHKDGKREKGHANAVWHATKATIAQ